MTLQELRRVTGLEGDVISILEQTEGLTWEAYRVRRG